MLELAKAVKSQLQRMREAAEFVKILNDESIVSRRAISASRTVGRLRDFVASANYFRPDMFANTSALNISQTY